MPLAAFAPRPRLPGSDTLATRSVCSQILLASGGGWITWVSLPFFIAATAPQALRPSALPVGQRNHGNYDHDDLPSSLGQEGFSRAPKPCWQGEITFPAGHGHEVSCLGLPFLFPLVASAFGLAGNSCARRPSSPTTAWIGRANATAFKHNGVPKVLSDVIRGDSVRHQGQPQVGSMARTPAHEAIVLGQCTPFWSYGGISCDFHTRRIAAR